MYVYIYIYTYVCIYICIYIHTPLQKRPASHLREVSAGTYKMAPSSRTGGRLVYLAQRDDHTQQPCEASKHQSTM